MPKISTLLVVALSLVALSRVGQAYTIDEYLTDVENNDAKLVSAKMAEDAAKVQLEESNLMFLPSLNATAEAGVSHADTFIPEIYGDMTETRVYQIGVGELTPFGLKANLSYKLNYQNISGATPQFIPVPAYYTAMPTLSISQSLWSNAFGAKDRADLRQKREMAKAGYYNALADYESEAMQARNAFLEVYFLQKTLAAENESLASSKALRDWERHRLNRQLIDKSDFLQADAAYQLQQLEIVKTQNDLKLAARKFNSLLNLKDDAVNKSLIAPELKMPNVQGFARLRRADLMAAEHSLNADEAESQVEKQKATPTLELFADYSYSDVDLYANRSLSDSWGYHDIYDYGIRFSAPLVFGQTERLRRAFQKSIEATELKLHRQRQDEARSLADLTDTIQNSEQQYELARTLTQLQKQKFDHEEFRHRRGRTTLFQVLQFQQDYLKAELGEIQKELSLREEINQLALYQPENGLQ